MRTMDGLFTIEQTQQIDTQEGSHAMPTEDSETHKQDEAYPTISYAFNGVPDEDEGTDEQKQQSRRLRIHTSLDIQTIASVHRHLWKLRHHRLLLIR